MAKKNDQNEQNTAGHVVGGFDLGSIEELPEVLPVGHHDGMTGTYLDAAGRPMQGPGIPDSVSPFRFCHIPADFGEEGKKAVAVENLKRKGYRIFKDVKVHGFPDAIVMGISRALYNEAQARKRQKPKAYAPEGGSIDKYNTGTVEVPVTERLPE